MSAEISGQTVPTEEPAAAVSGSAPAPIKGGWKVSGKQICTRHFEPRCNAICHI